MQKIIELAVEPGFINDKVFIKELASKNCNCSVEEINGIIIKKRSIDARSKNPVFRITLQVFINEPLVKEDISVKYKPVSSDKKVIIIGCGPAGMFAALKLIELNIRPIIIERGKDVQTRRKDLKEIQQNHIVNPESNYCFGEGGAGTYSDGKLYTRSTKRGDIKKILSVFVQHGASEDILIDAHPHIGSNKLPKVVKNMRETILSNCGEIHFNSKLTDLIIKNENVKGIIINNEKELFGDSVLLATGHSARDIYYLLDKNNIKIEAKTFALGVRIEHPQQLINEIQYHSKNKNENLPAASYNLACEVERRGVYSFCMCPGGIIVPAATSPGEIVVNGMSMSRRDSKFANSGFVVTVTEEEWKKYNSAGALAGLLLQEEIEQLSFELANKTQSAPAQKATDFVNKKLSKFLNESSYIPGLTSAPLHSALPEFITKRLTKALLIFNNKMKGYFSDEAQIVATESRTSSPIRIPRDKETNMHPYVKGLFPCGEGAGYAGGIVSAAMDGENCANSINEYLK